MRWSCHAGSRVVAAGIDWACTPGIRTDAQSWRCPATRSCGARYSTNSRAGSQRISASVSPAPSLRKRGPHLARGSRVPDFVLASLVGKPWSLSKLRGNVVLLNFWASWCEPCRQELPHLQQLHERHSDDGLVVLGVTDEDPETAQRYLREHDIDYPSLHDGDGSAMQSYQINAIPTSLIIGRDGELLERVEGYTPASTFSKALKTLLTRTSGSLGSGWSAGPDDTGSRTAGAGRR